MHHIPIYIYTHITYYYILFLPFCRYLTCILASMVSLCGLPVMGKIHHGRFGAGRVGTDFTRSGFSASKKSGKVEKCETCVSISKMLFLADAWWGCIYIYIYFCVWCRKTMISSYFIRFQSIPFIKSLTSWTLHWVVLCVTHAISGDTTIPTLDQHAMYCKSS